MRRYRRELLLEAIEIGKRLDAGNIEIRNLKTLKSIISKMGKCDGEENDL